jgi:hypothetical protein
LRHFLARVRGQEAPIVTGEEGLRALTLAHQLVEASERVQGQHEAGEAEGELERCNEA